MAKPKLTDKDFQTAAKTLRCEVAAIKAVAEVESRGEGFYADGFPVILFERHKFYKYCDRKRRAAWAAEYSSICNPVAGGYGKPGKNQRDKFTLAFSLDPEAAMMACSWGKFQVMGFNYDDLGYASIHEFVELMKTSEAAHLDAFVRFVKVNGLADEIRNLQWADFARRYNGEGYKKNKYDAKMAANYKKYKQIDADSKPTVRNPIIEQAGSSAGHSPNSLTVNAASNISGETSPGNSSPGVTTGQLEPVVSPELATEKTVSAEQETPQGTIKSEVSTVNEQDVNQPAEVTEPKPQGFVNKLIAGVTTLLGGTVLYDSLGKFSGIQFTAQTIYIILFILFLAFLGFCVWAILDTIKQNKRTEIEAMAKTAVDRKDIVWVKPESKSLWQSFKEKF